MSLTMSQGQLFVYGGVRATETLNDVWSFNTSSFTWTELAPGPTPLSGHTAHVYRDSMLVFFGYSSILGYSSLVLEYNFSKLSLAE